MLKQLICTLLLNTFGTSFLYSQTVIQGSVKNKEGEAAANVIVTIQNASIGTITRGVSTDKAGKYRLKFNQAADSILVTVRGMMIEKTMRILPNRSAIVDFEVNMKVVQLKDISIKVNPINRRSDTLSYVVGAFKEQDDRTIEDVLKKMPGIDISSSGKISYNGKAINKFYIEDLDMLDGRYNIATKNIAAEDVASVQVYENHKTIKAENKFSDQVAINLRLKNGAKGAWTAQMLTGLGYKPSLWNAELTAMRFSYNRQHISVYKGNNSGYTANEELLRQYDSGAQIFNTGDMLSLTQPDIPNLDKKRYVSNTTNSVSVNQLIKVNDMELTANANFYNEQLDKDGRSLITQYLPGSEVPLVIEEITANTSKENNLNVTLGVQENGELKYFHNKLDIRTSWSSGFTDLERGRNNFTQQHLDNPYFSIADELNMMKRINNHLFRFHFDVSYKDSPHKLRIAPAYYFSSDSLETLSQQVKQKFISCHLHTSYGLTLGKFTLNYTPKISINLHKLNSELTAIDRYNKLIPAADSVKNYLWYNRYHIGVDQDYTYLQGNKLRVRLSIPVYISIIQNNDRIADNSTIYKRLIVNPVLMADYSLSPVFKTVINGYYNKSYGSINDAYKGYILQSYRNLLRNTTESLLENSGFGGRLGIEYSNVISMFFMNAGGNYQHCKKSLFYGYNYCGIVGTKIILDQPTNSDSYNLHVSLSKAFKLWNTKFEAMVGLNGSKSDLLLQNIIQHFRTKSYSIGCSVKTAPSRYFNLSYDFAWLKSQQWVERGEKLQPIQNLAHNAKMWIFPTDKVSINLNIDYQHFDNIDSPNMFFTDAIIRYSRKSVEWDLECNNLFNTQTYLSTIYLNMGTYINSYQLRHRNVMLKARFKLK